MTAPDFTIGSLFSGIGGLELGLERAIPGARVAWQVEQNDYARAVLAQHWPDATRFEDVHHVGRANLARVDCICGGFPCQDISVAGNGEGLGGARSGLWFQFLRILEELRPPYAVIENVSVLRSRGLHIVLAGLHALGYDAEWHCLPAAAVGAPHRRDRIFILAYLPDPDRGGLRELEQREPRGRTGGVCDQRPALPLPDGAGRLLADPAGRLESPESDVDGGQPPVDGAGARAGGGAGEWDSPARARELGGAQEPEGPRDVAHRDRSRLPARERGPAGPSEGAGEGAGAERSRPGGELADPVCSGRGEGGQGGPVCATEQHGAPEAGAVAHPARRRCAAERVSSSPRHEGASGGDTEREGPRGSRKHSSGWRIWRRAGWALVLGLEHGREQWAAEPHVGRVADGVPSRVDRLTCLGNAVVPHAAAVFGRIIAIREGLIPPDPEP